jgi:hypothetical protein
MDIQEITNEIKHKLNHVVSTKVPAYTKSLENETEEDKESKVSLYVTDLTFQVSDRIIKERISRINPKPLTFTFHINRGKYFEQTINDLMKQINQEVYFDQEEVNLQKAKFDGAELFEITFQGYFLRDYGYIGSKHITQTEEIVNNWFPAILSCMRIKDVPADEAEDMLNFLKQFVLFGFQKAINMQHVFVDMVKMDESLYAVEYVSVGDKKLTTEEFKQFREENILNKKKK